MAYDLADPVPLTVETRDANGVLANATTVTLTVGLPDGTTATPTVNNPSVGRYQADYIPTMPGRHTVRWVATGINASGFSDTFDVALATPDYIISLQDAKTILRFTTTTQDEDVRPYVEATTAIIERYLQQAVIRRSYTENHYSVGYAESLVLNRYPVISLTSLVSIDGVRTYSVLNLDLDKNTGLVSALPGTPPLWGNLIVTYIAGRAVVPANYQQAAKIILQHLWSTRRGMGSAPAVGRFGEFATPVGLGFALPNAAKELLGPSEAPLAG